MSGALVRRLTGAAHFWQVSVDFHKYHFKGGMSIQPTSALEPQALAAETYFRYKRYILSDRMLCTSYNQSRRTT